MAVTSARSVTIQFSGDFLAANVFSAANNTASPAQHEIVTLANGNNTITPPGGGATPKAVTIIPPDSNDVIITLKGVNGDTGVALHVTDPTTIALNSPTDTFVLSVTEELAGVTLIWS